MRKPAVAIGGVFLVCLLFILKPALIKTDDHTGLLVLFRGQSGLIQFVNSVTERPVTIHFQIGGRFKNFSFATDETTEAYYTNGLFSLNEAVSKESTDALRFCSMKGISLSLGFYHFFLKDGCLEVKLLWAK
jgi:hypothetical protein